MAYEAWHFFVVWTFAVAVNRRDISFRHDNEEHRFKLLTSKNELTFPCKEMMPTKQNHCFDSKMKSFEGRGDEKEVQKKELISEKRKHICFVQQKKNTHAFYVI